MAELVDASDSKSGLIILGSGSSPEMGIFSLKMYIFLSSFLALLLYYILNNNNQNTRLGNVSNITNFVILFVLNLFLIIGLIYQLSNNNVVIIYFFNSFYYVIGIDKLSSIFVLLTIFLFVLCFIYNMKQMLVKQTTWFIIIIMIFIGLIITFMAQDLMLFLVGFEFVLIPLF